MYVLIHWQGFRCMSNHFWEVEKSLIKHVTSPGNKIGDGDTSLFCFSWYFSWSGYSGLYFWIIVFSFLGCLIRKSSGTLLFVGIEESSLNISNLTCLPSEKLLMSISESKSMLGLVKQCLCYKCLQYYMFVRYFSYAIIDQSWCILCSGPVISFTFIYSSILFLIFHSLRIYPS